MKNIGLEIPQYDTSLDPTRNTDINSKEMDWTIPTSRIKEMKILYKKVCTPVKRKRRATFMYEREDVGAPKYTPKRDKKKQDLKQEFSVKQEKIDESPSLSNYNNEESKVIAPIIPKLEPMNNDSNEATAYLDFPIGDSNIT